MALRLYPKVGVKEFSGERSRNSSWHLLDLDLSHAHTATSWLTMLKAEAKLAANLLPPPSTFALDRTIET